MMVVGCVVSFVWPSPGHCQNVSTRRTEHPIDFELHSYRTSFFHEELFLISDWFDPSFALKVTVVDLIGTALRAFLMCLAAWAMPLKDLLPSCISVPA